MKRRTLLKATPLVLAPKAALASGVHVQGLVHHLGVTDAQGDTVHGEGLQLNPRADVTWEFGRVVGHIVKVAVVQPDDCLCPAIQVEAVLTDPAAVALMFDRRTWPWWAGEFWSERETQDINGYRFHHLRNVEFRGVALTDHPADFSVQGVVRPVDNFRG